jgi:voltage-gated potassium channel
LHSHFHLYFLRLPLVIRIFIITAIVILAFGTGIHFIEPNTFLKISDGVWWAIITATSVGYGDLVPKTVLGRFAAVLLILVGAGFVSTYFNTLATTAVTKQSSFLEGKVAYKKNGHLIIVGWNERTREIIDQLLKLDPQQPIVLIDETLKINPLIMKHIHYIQGKAHTDETILKCNVHGAKKVLITADQSKDELQADMNSILTLLSFKGVCPDIQCIVEILTKEQVINAKRAGADEIIQTNNLMSVFMLNSLDSENHGLMREVFNHFRDQELKVLEPEASFLEMDFSEACKELLIRGVLLLGIKKGENIMIHPPHSVPIENGDKLITMKASIIG